MAEHVPPTSSWTSISNTSDSLNFSNITSNTNFRAIVQNGVCPTDTSLQAVVTSSITIADFSAPDVCYIDSTHFSNLSSVQNGNISFYTWDFGDNSATILRNPVHVFNAPGIYSVSLVITTTKGCSDTAIKNIQVYALPVANAGNDTTIRMGQSAQLNGSGGITYNWSPTGSLNNPALQNPLATPQQTTQYSLIVIDQNGCSNTDSVIVKLLGEYDFIASNLVTPNEDGYNDFWHIENITAYPECQISVFNRYGIPVFTTSAYSNNWDGTFEGSQLPDGTYYYVITCPDTDELFKGHLTILTK